MIVRVGAVVWLTVVWCAVMESVELGTVVAGALVASALVLLFPSRSAPLGRVRVQPLSFLVMNAVLFVDLVRANLQVAWAVIAPERAGLRRGIVAVPLPESSELVLDFLLNAVSLTPGTLILEVRREPTVLYIHVLQLRSEPDVHRAVLTIQRRMVAALGPRSALEEIDRRLAELPPDRGTMPQPVRAPHPEPDPDLPPGAEPDPASDPRHGAEPDLRSVAEPEPDPEDDR